MNAGTQNLRNKSSWLLRVLLMAAGLIFLKSLAKPITHRLSPDIGVEGEKKEGQVVGFHYTIESWWGFRKKTYDDIRFVPIVGPQYQDPISKKWIAIPREAWAEPIETDDREEGNYYN